MNIYIVLSFIALFTNNCILQSSHKQSNYRKNNPYLNPLNAAARKQAYNRQQKQSFIGSLLMGGTAILGGALMGPLSGLLGGVGAAGGMAGGFGGAKVKRRQGEKV